MQKVETSVQQEVGAAPAKAVRFRKFACDIAFQGQGIGSTLLAYAQDIAREHFGASILWCDARVSAIAWYERRGYSTFGESFYKGPVEYCRMRIDI
jgi:ribosomal protein S18 acetylase RimI-like enzyme